MSIQRLIIFIFISVSSMLSSTLMAQGLNLSPKDHFWDFKRSIFSPSKYKDGTPYILNYEISQNIYFQNTHDKKNNVSTTLFFQKGKMRFPIGYIYSDFSSPSQPKQNSKPTYNATYYVREAQSQYENKRVSTLMADPTDFFNKEWLETLSVWATDDALRNTGFHKFLNFVTFVQRYADELEVHTRELDRNLSFLEKKRDSQETTPLEKAKLTEAIDSYVKAYEYSVTHDFTKKMILYSSLDVISLSPLFGYVVGKFVSKLGSLTLISKMVSKGSKVGQYLAGVMGKSAVEITSAAEIAFSKLPLGSQKLLLRAAAIGAKPIVVIKEASRITVARFEIANEIFVKKINSMPKTKEMMELFFPVHLSFDKQVLPLLKRNLIWSLSTGTISQYLARRDKFVSQLDEVIMDLAVSQVLNVFLTPWSAVPKPVSGNTILFKRVPDDILSFSRRIPMGLLSSSIDTTLTHLRTAGFHMPDRVAQESLIKRWESSVAYNWTLSNNGNLVNDHAMREIDKLRLTKPAEAAVVDVIYRVSMSIYTGAVRILVRNQINPYKSSEPIEDRKRSAKEEEILKDMSVFAPAQNTAEMKTLEELN